MTRQPSRQTASWWIGALPGLEDLGPGARVVVLRDAPGASVDIVRGWYLQQRATVEGADGDPERPAWRIGEADSTPRQGQYLQVFARAFTILETAPGWRRFGPRGEAVIDVLRRARSLTMERILAAADQPLPPGEDHSGLRTGLDWFLAHHGSRSERLRWRLGRKRRRSVKRAESGIFWGLSRLPAELDDDWPPAEYWRSRWVQGRLGDGWQVVQRSAIYAAAAATAGDLLGEASRAWLNGPWQALALPPAAQRWGPFPERGERLSAEVFRLIVRELVAPPLVSPKQALPAGSEVVSLWPLPFRWYSEGLHYLGGPLESPDEHGRIVPAGTPIGVGETVKRGTRLTIPGEEWPETDRKMVFWSLVAPGEPILADHDRAAALLERIRQLAAGQSVFF